MKALFVHDHKFLSFNGEIYSNGGLSNVALKRYLQYFDNLLVMGRCVDIADVSDMQNTSRSSVDKVDFRFVKYSNLFLASLFHRKEIGNEILEYVIQCDCAIIRLPSILGVTAIPILRKAGKPYVIEMVGCVLDALWCYSLTGKILAPYMWYLNRKCIKKASHVIYITEGFLQKRYPTTGNSYVCSNVTLAISSDDILEKRIDKLSLGSGADKIVLGSIGALVKYKGHAYVIRALQSLIKMGHNVYYEVVGRGDQSYLMTLAKNHNVGDHVRMHGSMPHSAVFEWLDSIDIYVQPSDAEGQGRSLIEAMSRGCPCVCTSVGGMVELVEPQFIAQKADPKDIARKVDLLLRSDLKKVAKRNFNYAKKFAPDIVVKEREAILRRVFMGDCDEKI